MQQKIFKVYLRHMKQSQVLIILFTAILVMAPSTILAQVEPPPPPPPDGELPIDSNLYVLGIIGLALGAYVVLKKKPLSGKPE
jgi:hypothetical protein